MKQDIYFGDTPIGEVFRPEYYRGYPVRSLALICPSCLVVWAELAAEGSEIYELVAVPCCFKDCRKAVHEILRPVPGSLINDWTSLGGIDEDLLALLPEYLLKREFNLTLKAIEEIWKPANVSSQLPASSPASTSSLKAPLEQAKLTP